MFEYLDNPRLDFYHKIIEQLVEFSYQTFFTINLHLIYSVGKILGLYLQVSSH